MIGDDIVTGKDYTSWRDIPDIRWPCVYALIDPDTMEIRYIGLTNNLHKRYRDHLAGDGNERKRQWIKRLKRIGRAPIVRCLQRTIPFVYRGNWFLEEFWILDCRLKGFDLLQDQGVDLSEIGMRIRHAWCAEVINTDPATMDDCFKDSYRKKWLAELEREFNGI